MKGDAEMLRARLITVAILAFIIFAVLSCSVKKPTRPEPEGGDVVELISPDDAEKFALTEEEWHSLQKLVYRGDGPEIIVEKPSVLDTKKGPTIITSSPFELKVEFRSSAAEVQMESLRAW